MSSRFARAVRTIIGEDDRSGLARVTAIEGRGRVRLEGRGEDVLVAGNAIPEIGYVAPWLRVDRGTLVIGAHVPMLPPMVLPSGKVLPTWTGAWATVITSAFDNGQYDNASPCCGADSLGHAWTAVCETVGDDFRLHFYRGDRENLLAAPGWASKAHIDFPHIGDPYYRTSGPGWRTPCLLMDDEDSLFAWWHRNFLWEAGQQTADALQGVTGTINPDTGALNLDPPVDVGLPYVDGFGPPYTPDYNGLEIAPDGYLWLVTLPKVTVQKPALYLLYGDDLEVGSYRYALAYQSASSELGCGNYTAVTTKAEADRPTTGGGYEEAGGNFPAGSWVFYYTFYKDDETSGNGETTRDPIGVGFQATQDGRRYRIIIRTGRANCTGRRVYCWLASEQNWFLVADVADNTSTEVIITDPPVGDEPTLPQVNTLPAKRVRVQSIDQGPPGTIARSVYRTQVGGSVYGFVGTVENNLNDQEWIDDTGDSIGAAPPNNPTTQSYRCLAVGHSNAPRSWGSGMTWEKVFGWYPSASLGNRCGIVALGGGLAAVIYQNSSWGLSARRRTTGGVWGGEVNLVTESGRGFRLGTIVLQEGQPQLCYIESGGWDDPDEWYYAPLSVSDDGVGMGSSVLAGEGWPYSEEPPRLSWDDDLEVLVMHGGGFNDFCHIFNVDEGDVESAGDDLSTAGAEIYSWTAPHRVPGPKLWGLFIDWDGYHGAVDWTPE